MTSSLKDKSSVSFFEKQLNKSRASINSRVEKIKSNPFGFLRSVFTFIGVAGCVLVVWLAVQPSLIFTNTTATGGDMGAHVWWPAFMRDFLLPHGRIFGWTMDNYSGFPVGQYYFPVPAIMVVIFDFLLPYNMAFKLVTVIGSVAFPISAYVLGRSIRAPKPIPMLMAFAATVFLFFTGDPRGNSTVSTLVDYQNANFNHHIMGGPLLSEMAGEFSFSIALTLGLFFLAAFYVMLRDGKFRARVAILLALTIMSHLVVAIFVFFAAIVFMGSVYAARTGVVRYIGYLLLSWVCLFAICIGAFGRYFFDNTLSTSTFETIAAGILFLVSLAIVGFLIKGWIQNRNLIIGFLRDIIPLIVGLLIASIWLVPLFARFEYTSNMRYEKLVDLASTPGANEVYELYISPAYFLWPVFIPAAIGFILSATLLRKSIVPVLVTATVMGVVFVMWPEGHAWNLRFLPFWYIFIFFVAAVGYGELFRIPSAIMSRVAYSQKNRNLLNGTRILTAGITGLLVLLFFIGLIGVGQHPKDVSGCPVVPDTRVFKDRRGFAHSWAEYNFEGYERKPQDNSCGQKSSDKKNYTSYTEFKTLMDTMAKLPAGRALWEPSEGAYGTTLALTLLPYYTDHRIASQEGLYYEAAGSTAYHFLTVAEVSKTPSNPMRWPKCEANKDGTKKDPNCFDSYYGTLADFDRGIEHMKMMGVTYYLAHSQEAKTAAQSSKKLELVASVADQDTFNPIGWDIYKIKGASVVEPLAVDPIVITDKTKPSDWAQSGNKWLYDWFNAVGQYPEFVNDGPSSWKRETAKKALENPMPVSEQKSKSKVKVSNVKIKQDSVSFNVDKIGEPVLVKVSYYPTFKASGAEKIYRASPNSMVVIPTSKNVKIEMKRDKVEWLSIVLFFLGIIGLILLKIGEKRPIKHLSALLGQKH